MVRVKLNGSNTVHRGGTVHSIGSYFWSSLSSSSSSSSSNANASLLLSSSSSLSVSTASPAAPPAPTRPPAQQRLLVSTLLGTFVFVTMFIPILRFIQYDDSHLFQSVLLLDTSTQGRSSTTASTSSSSSASSSTVTLMDVALGKAPISDYVQSPPKSLSSISSTTATKTTFSSATTDKPEHSIATPHHKSQLLRHAPNDILEKDTITTSDHTEEEKDEVEEDTSSLQETEEENAPNEEDDDKVADPELVNEEKAEEVEEEDEEEVQILPTLRVIPPFSWEQQLDSANRYLKSFTNVGRTTNAQSTHPNHDSLLFFHIPKTAGTAIEYAAGTNPDRPLAWGSCRFNHTPKRDICHYPAHSQPWPQYVGWWHLPVQLFPIANNNPYKNAELFGVVRDPYDRMVSEFYYICTLKVMKWRPNQCDRSRLSEASYMNEWLSDKIRNRETDSGRSYLIDNGHFTPQYDYIYGPNQVRMLDYVLFMDSEHFNDDFATLMNAYDLPNVQLKKLNALGATARGDDHLDTTHLDTKTIQWIHNMYPDDFGIGGYEKKSI